MDTCEPATSESPPAGIEPENQWRTMYAAERKRARILGATTVAASLLAVGAGVWGLTANEVTGQTVGPGTSQFGQPGTPGQGGPRRQDLSALLFNADGSVNTALLQEFLSRMPGGSGGLQQFLAMAASNGELTRAEADAIAETIDGSPATGKTAQDT